MSEKIPFIDLRQQCLEIKEDLDPLFERIFSSCQFIMSAEVKECEKRLAQTCGAKYCITASSGTDALLMALMACDVGVGDEVIVPSFSFVATAEVVALIGATAVFVDIDPNTYLMDVQQVESAVTPRTKAVIPVSLYGQPADLHPLMKLANQHGLKVIEDAAQSFGARYQKSKSCAVADISCTSFFPTKPLGCYGDGGAVFTNDPKMAESLSQIRDHGQKSKYNHVRVGINGRFDSLQAAVILAKLKTFDQDIKRRQEIAATYTKALKRFDEALNLPRIKEDRTSAWALYTLRVSRREHFRRALEDQGIPSAVHYPVPIHLQKAYCHYQENLKLPISEAYSEQVLSLPLYPHMPEEHIDKVIKAVQVSADQLQLS